MIHQQLKFQRAEPRNDAWVLQHEALLLGHLVLAGLQRVLSPTSQRTAQRLRWPMVPVGMGWLDASPANIANAWYAFSPVAELEDLYRSGFDDCERFLREECPGLVLAPYISR